ncbi:regulatory protein RecX [Corynebacterium mendelii]|uniref:Regulatory protein RecX n=1 Tax=Corynebacterium mendelii TaxID=2765362 RepID=A0A939E0M9_9CORY|nr:regulatory protein RecX [Corynebacterium mendelii]MBN9643307.1 regulatory protein RecX [Corynebacterium mendelii]
MDGTQSPDSGAGPDPRVIEALKKAVEHAAHNPRGGLVDPLLEKNKAEVRHRALLLLNQRSRSRGELADRLEQLDFDPELTEMVLDDLQRAGLVDDLAFATEWVRQRHARRGKSRQMLDKELREKKVPAGIRREALDQLDDSAEERTATALAVKKASRITAVPADRAMYDKYLRRILGVLARRGFPQSMSMSLAKKALDDRIAELGGTG